MGLPQDFLKKGFFVCSNVFLSDNKINKLEKTPQLFLLLEITQALCFGVCKYFLFPVRGNHSVTLFDTSICQ